jgi:hypothetical protein
VLKGSRRDQRKKVSFLWPRNHTGVTPLTSAAKCFSLSHRMGEGRGEGRNAEQPKRTVEFTRCALTLNPSPVRREREMRDSAEGFIQFLGSKVNGT